MMSNGSAFAVWLSENMKKNKISDTKLGGHLGVSATAIIRWRNGTNVPRDSGMIDAVADFFKADRTEVRVLAGRGNLLIGADGLNQEFAEIAYVLQMTHQRIKRPIVQDYFLGLIKRKMNEASTEMEAVSDLEEAIKNEEDN